MIYNDNTMDDSVKGSKKAVKWVKELVERRKRSIEATEELLAEMTPILLANKKTKNPA